MRMRQLLAGAGLATAMLWAGGASAIPIPLGGYTGPVVIKFADFESFTGTGTIAPGNMNFGVFEVTTIETPAAQILYQSPITPSAADPLLVGVFNGIDVTSVSGTEPNEQSFNTGGTFEIFQSPTTVDFTQGTSGYTNAGCAIGSLCYNGITTGGNTDALNFNLVPGATAQDPTSTLFTTGSFVFPISGAANGFADITGGADAFQFGRNGYTTADGTLADLSVQDDFCSNGTGLCGAAVGNWLLRSQDPVQANVVPEPTSLALLGTALLGFGSLARRRRRK